ncbi:MAG: hypothetical protein R3B09_34865 [Nannocystaceae bacterium]
MGRRPTSSDAPATGDLFAHFGVDLVAAPEPAAKRVLPAAGCPRCGWLCVALPCPVCGHLRTPRLRRAPAPE